MRLIDADALKNELSDKDYITYTHEYGDAIPVNWIMSAIDNAPTVDLEKLGESLRCQIRAEYGSCDDCELSCPRNEIIKLFDLERPQGSWIYIGQRNGLKVVECTNCHKRQYGSMKYCGNCGADMRGEKNETDN